MRNEFTEFKTLLQFLSPSDQIFEIDCEINDIIKDDTPYLCANKIYNRIKHLKKLKHDILLKLCKNSHVLI